MLVCSQSVREGTTSTGGISGRAESRRRRRDRADEEGARRRLAIAWCSYAEAEHEDELSAPPPARLPSVHPTMSPKKFPAAAHLQRGDGSFEEVLVNGDYMKRVRLLEGKDRRLDVPRISS